MLKKKNIVSLFSCGGGMDIGFEGGFKILKQTLNLRIHKDWIESEDDKYYTLKSTDFETVFANDIVEDAKTLWCNYFDKKKNKDTSDIYHVESIVDIVKRYRNGETDIFPNEVDIVTGGFPCQDFSVAGKRNGFSSHKDHNGRTICQDIPSEETRGKLYMWMRDVIEITMPKIFIAENVKGLANLKDVKEIIKKDFSNIGNDGYIVLEPQILHAGEYGVSQSRERIFFIGFKKSALCSNALEKLSCNYIDTDYSPYPCVTHSLENQGDLFVNSDVNSFVPCGDILRDLKEPDVTCDISQKYYSKAKFMGVHCQGQKEINLNRLAPTIRSEHHGNIEFRRLSTSNGGMNIDELNAGYIERRLTLRECARIQTFPDDYNFVLESVGRKKFVVSPSSAYKIVGNAVPPLLAYHIAKKIEGNWNKYFNRIS